MRPFPAALIALSLCLPLSQVAAAPPVSPPEAQAAVGLRGAPAFAFEEATIADLQARMRAGTLDSVTLTQAYLERIAAIDGAGPTLRAVIELNPEALREAEARDTEHRAGRARGPLHGIPVLVKDNIDAVPMANSGGSLALAEHRPRADAPLVAQLRAAGAVFLGPAWSEARLIALAYDYEQATGHRRAPTFLPALAIPPEPVPAPAPR